MTIHEPVTLFIFNRALKDKRMTELCCAHAKCCMKKLIRGDKMVERRFYLMLDTGEHRRVDPVLRAEGIGRAFRMPKKRGWFSRLIGAIRHAYLQERA